MIKVISATGRAVGAYPLIESVSKVTVNKETPKMFKMLANYPIKGKLIIKKNKN